MGVLARYFIVPPGAVKWRRYAVCGVLNPRERSEGEIVRFLRLLADGSEWAFGAEGWCVGEPRVVCDDLPL